MKKVLKQGVLIGLTMMLTAALTACGAEKTETVATANGEAPASGSSKPSVELLNVSTIRPASYMTSTIKHSRRIGRKNKARR